MTLSAEVVDSLNSKRPPTKEDTCSMSTAAFTTESTRLKLKDARTKIDTQRDEIAQQAAELEQLRLELDQLRHSTKHLKVSAGPFEHTIVFDNHDPLFHEEMITCSPAQIDSTMQPLDDSPPPKANLLRKFSRKRSPSPSSPHQGAKHDEGSDQDSSAPGSPTSSSAHTPSVGSVAVVDLIDDGHCDC